MKIPKADQKVLIEKNISESMLKSQLQRFRNGFAPLDIIAPATDERGIKKYNESEKEQYVEYYREESKKYELLKFIPSSGAATRMFKQLFEFCSTYKGDAEQFCEFVADTSEKSVYFFFQNIQKFSFYEDLDELCRKKCNESVDNLIEQHRYIELLELILSDKGLNLGFKPKALIRFHRYADENRTPIAEHLVSAYQLLEGQDPIQVHFTVTEDSLKDFEAEARRQIKKIEEKAGCTFNITYSFQKSETDTVAVTRDNEIFRTGDGKILFRPGGHGALIHNLDGMLQDIIFLKNIDNVVPDWGKEKNTPYEMFLGGVLLSYQQKIFNYLQKLEKNDSAELLDEITTFVREELCYDFVGESTVDVLCRILNRPLRVCGMVINEGEPGGGPFFVKDDRGNVSLQIVESSQIDLDNENQKEIMEQSTHFNPVDIVCGVKDYNGNKFELLQFVDEEAGFISNKSLNGRNLKALELPGLWNGAMAHWNTIFVEVPDFTFNPVKTVSDLLRPQHSN